MSIVDLIKSIFGNPSKKRINIIPSTLHFPELDIEQMKHDFKLEEEGKRRGANNYPHTDNQSFDDIEEQIITAIEGVKRLAYEKRADQLRTYGDRIASLGFQTRFSQFMSIGNEAKSEFIAKGHVGADLLYQLRRDVILADDEIERFRKEHNLQRLTQRPPSQTLRWGVIAVLFMVECVLNGTFFAAGNEMGMLGGVIEAGVIAALNIGSGLLEGWKIAPRVTHRHPLWKLFGIIGSFLYIVWIFGFNLAVAHYRHAHTVIQPEAVARLAIESLLTHPLDIVDMQAWLLFALGIGFSVVAALDGWLMDDPYPGYGAVAKRQVDKNDEYIEQKQILISELEEIRDSAQAQMDLISDEIGKKWAEYRAIQQARIRLERNFWQYLDYLEQCANDLLATYRETNRRERKTPPPAHFSRRWKMPRPSDPSFDLEGFSKDSESEAELGHMFAQLYAQRQKVHEDYESAVLAYERIDTLIPEDLRNG